MTEMAKFIEIDAAHRIPDHHSKCRSLHGHRYKIEAVCVGPLATAGAQRAMVGGLDFSFLKEEMITAIDAPCDHGLILCITDPILEELDDDLRHDIAIDIERQGYCKYNFLVPFGKVYILPEPPTAEVLSVHWYNRLYDRVKQRSSNLASLRYIKVYETPTCWAKYPST